MVNQLSLFLHTREMAVLPVSDSSEGVGIRTRDLRIKRHHFYFGLIARKPCDFRYTRWLGLEQSNASRPSSTNRLRICSTLARPQPKASTISGSDLAGPPSA